MHDVVEAKTPSPPEPFDPLTETIPAGSVFYRVHEPAFPDGSGNDGTVPNPGYGKPTRFAFFGDPPVPVLYLADKPEGAVHESILHDAEPGSFIPRVRWRTKVLSAITVRTDLEVAVFHSDGLRKFNLYAHNLTDTDATRYPQTVHWAEAAWCAGAQGVSYMCRHYNTARALCLFGDRLPPGGLQTDADHPAARAFALPQDAEWATGLALTIGVVLRS
jgi:hypothetical protein